MCLSNVDGLITITCGNQEVIFSGFKGTIPMRAKSVMMVNFNDDDGCRRCRILTV